jgi:hypothetical protein
MGCLRGLTASYNYADRFLTENKQEFLLPVIIIMIRFINTKLGNKISPFLQQINQNLNKMTIMDKTVFYF